MKSNDVFTLAVRLVGLLGMFYVIRHLAVVWHKTGTPHLDDPLVLFMELGLMGVGLCMIIFAPTISRLLSRDDPDRDIK